MPPKENYKEFCSPLIELNGSLMNIIYFIYFFVKKKDFNIYYLIKIWYNTFAK